MFKKGLRVSELPPSRIIFTNNDRVYCVTNYYFKGLEVIAENYTLQDDGLTFTKLPNERMRPEDLPAKVKKIFNARSRSGVEYLIENGQLTRVKLE